VGDLAVRGERERKRMGTSRGGRVETGEERWRAIVFAILALETYTGAVKKVLLQTLETSHFGGIGRTPLKTYCSTARLQSRIGLLLFSKRMERNPACLGRQRLQCTFYVIDGQQEDSHQECKCFRDHFDKKDYLSWQAPWGSGPKEEDTEKMHTLEVHYVH
jgi:hypothetical protein